MNIIVIVNILSLGFLSGAILILGIRIKKDPDNYPYIFILVSFTLLLFVTITNILEHSGITSYFDKYEDFLEVLFIPFFVLSIYSFRVNEELKKRKEADYFLQKVLETSPASIYIYDLIEKKMSYLNTNKLRVNLNGNTISNIPGEQLINRIHPDDIPLLEKHYNKLRREGENSNVYQIEYRILNQHDQYVEVVNYETVFSYGTYNNHVHEVVGVTIDITEKKQALRAIEESETKYREIVENAQTAIIKLDLQGNLTYYNEYAQNLFGYSPNEIIGQNIADTLFRNFERNEYENDLRYTRSRILANFLKIQSQSTYDFWTTTKKGDLLYINWNNRPIFNENKKITGILCIGSDTTVLKNVFDALNDSVTKFKTLFENANDAILLIDKDLMFTECNSKALILFGLEREQILNTRLDFYMPPVQPNGENSENFFRKKANLSFNGKSQVFEAVIYNNEKKIIYTVISFNSFELANEKHIQVLIRDITVTRKLEQQLLVSSMQAEENERKRFARELHDGIGPVLSTIKMYFQWLSECIDSQEYQHIIDHGNKNIEEAILSLREVSNNLSPHILVNHGLVNALINFIDRIKETSDIDIVLKQNINERMDSLAEVTIYRVITELLNNTLKYAKASQIYIQLKKGSRFFEVTYADNGIGCNLNEVLKSKKGAGLSNIQNRIKTFRGQMKIDSKPNKGFQLKFKLDLMLMLKLNET